MTDPYQRTSQTVSVWFFLAVMALTVLTALGFLYLGRSLAPGANLPTEELKILSRAFDRIDEHYIYDLSEERRSELMHAAVSGMVKKLDGYSKYYPPQKSEDYDKGTRGIMTGIGVVVQSPEKKVVLVYPIPGGPAESAGLRVGDVITKVEGESVETSAAAVKAIKGELNTKAKLTIQRGEEPPFDVLVNRKRVVIPSVKWARILDKDKGIGYVYLEKFSDNSASELDLTLQFLDSELGKGRRLRGLVFDLRQNPGGLLDTCRDVTNRFLRGGKIVTLKRRNTADVIHLADPDKCTRPDLALILLLDGGSASASEVFAGALRDHERAKIVGVRSYGKGVVQSVFSWNNRKELVKITTSSYLTPGGRNIESHLRPEPERGQGGIPADREVNFASRKDYEAVTLRLRRREVPRKYRPAVEALSEAHPKITFMRPLDPADDVQLAAALEEVSTLIRAADAPPPQPETPNSGTPTEDRPRSKSPGK